MNQTDHERGVVSAGRKVRLRQKRVEDAADDYRWRVDPELAELDAASAIRTPFEEFVRQYKDEMRYPTLWVRRFAVETLDGRHIGNCMVYDLDMVSGEGEVGIMIGDRDYWGKGYGRDAMAQLVEQCFRMDAMRRLYLHTLEWNARARRAFAACGFREVRPVRRGGKAFTFMELTKAEWEAIRDRVLGAPPSMADN